MKLIIASDIHGSAGWCQKLLALAEKEQPQQLLLLGDLLYHGPRNALPGDYATMDVTEQLNAYTGPLLCVRGNCDAEVDQMLLNFPIQADYALVEADGLIFFATHGHLYNEACPPRQQEGLVLLNGHTHIPACVDHGGYHYINPGSVSIPKGGSVHSCILYEQRRFRWVDLHDGSVWKEVQL